MQPVFGLRIDRSPWAYRYRPSLRTRLTALALSLAICLGIALMLIWMGMIGPGAGERRQKFSAVSFSADPVRKQGGTQAAAKAPVAPVRPLPREVAAQPLVVPSPKPVTMPPLDLSRKTSDEVSSFDLGKLPKHAGGGAGAGQNSAAAYGPGEGPGGMKLYNAEWYREPTDAEIVTYLPKRQVEAEWAMIACKTVERYRVENCQELGESPRGSGLARAMRQAAWQFLVRPPRIDGKPLIGSWVRIRFDFKRAAKPGEPPQ